LEGEARGEEEEEEEEEYSNIGDGAEGNTNPGTLIMILEEGGKAT
jgi:hypothetical protein